MRPRLTKEVRAMLLAAPDTPTAGRVTLRAVAGALELSSHLAARPSKRACRIRGDRALKQCGSRSKRQGAWTIPGREWREGGSRFGALR